MVVDRKRAISSLQMKLLLVICVCVGGRGGIFVFVLLTASVLATNKKKAPGGQCSLRLLSIPLFYDVRFDYFIHYCPVASVYVCARLELKSEK